MTNAATPDSNNPHGEPTPVREFVEKPFMASLRKMSWNEFLSFMNPPQVPVHVPNPKRQTAGRLNRQKREGLTDAGRQRLRDSAATNRPWQHSTGPKSGLGKLRAAQNGRKRQQGATSIRQMKADLRTATACGVDLSAILEMLPSGVSDVCSK